LNCYKFSRESKAMKRNKDDSVEIIIRMRNQNTNNWLSAPKGGFHLVLKQFRSITVDVNVSWAFIDNPMRRSGLGLFNTPVVKMNDDGSVDVYFGLEAPQGLESNWVPTSGKKPCLWLRKKWTRRSFPG